MLITSIVQPGHRPRIRRPVRLLLPSSYFTIALYR